LAKETSSPWPIVNENQIPFRFDPITLVTDNSHKIKKNATGIVHEFTVLLIGGSRTGKTSMIRRFVTGGFSSKYKRSVDFKEYRQKCTVPIELHEKTLADSNMDSGLDSIGMLCSDAQIPTKTHQSANSMSGSLVSGMTRTTEEEEEEEAAAAGDYPLSDIS